MTTKILIRLFCIDYNIQYDRFLNLSAENIEDMLKNMNMPLAEKQRLILSINKLKAEDQVRAELFLFLGKKKTNFFISRHIAYQESLFLHSTAVYPLLPQRTNNNNNNNQSISLNLYPQEPPQVIKMYLKCWKTFTLQSLLLLQETASKVLELMLKIQIS